MQENQEKNKSASVPIAELLNVYASAPLIKLNPLLFFCSATIGLLNFLPDKQIQKIGQQLDKIPGIEIRNDFDTPHLFINTSIIAAFAITTLQSFMGAKIPNVELFALTFAIKATNIFSNRQMTQFVNKAFPNLDEQNVRGIFFTIVNSAFAFTAFKSGDNQSGKFFATYAVLEAINALHQLIDNRELKIGKIDLKDKNVLRLVALAIGVFSFITTTQGTPSSSVTGVTLDNSNARS